MPDEVRIPTQRLRGGLRPVVLGVAALVVAGSAAVTMPGTACACSCAVSETPEAAVSDASGVFVGRATDKVSTGFTDIYEFEVSEVFKGDVGSTTTVGTLSNGNGCGTSYEVGQEYSCSSRGRTTSMLHGRATSAGRAAGEMSTSER